jgi:hypothetical protein
MRSIGLVHKAAVETVVETGRADCRPGLAGPVDVEQPTSAREAHNASPASHGAVRGWPDTGRLMEVTPL